MTSIMDRIRAASNAFWNPPGSSGSSFGARRQDRYSWYWALYWNTAYDVIGAYLQNYPSTTKLYRHTRGLRSPVGRWVDFYTANIWGGVLDLNAGDGSSQTSAIPIVTENENLRKAIAKVWQWSNWNSKRTLATLYSTTLGDVILKVVDRPSSNRVYMQVWWPGDVIDMTWDDFGNVKRVVFETRILGAATPYTYKEIIEHPSEWGGSRTRFQTFRDGRPHGFESNGGKAVWEVPYDFVPVVHIPWNDVGQEWGAVGFTKTVRKIDAANALASQLADQIGKAVNTPLVAYGMKPGSVTVQADQEGVPILYVGNATPETRIEPLISDLSLEAALKVLDSQLADIKEDLPELRLSESLRSGLSGEALGRAFSDVMAQVQSVRANHDSALVRVHQMAVAIGGASGYDPVFAEFDLNSFRAGKLDHGIGPRPVLPRSREEELAELERKWNLVNTLATSGEIPLEVALREILGWGDDRLKEFGEQKLAAIKLEQEDAYRNAELYGLPLPGDEDPNEASPDEDQKQPGVKA